MSQISSGRTRSMLRALWMGARLAALLVFCLGAVCNTFSPRDPQPPCDPRTDLDCVEPARFDEPGEPSIVRDNIERALETPTVEPNYQDSVTGPAPEDGGVSFEYIPDAQSRELNPDLFVGWDEVREVQFMLNLLETGANRALDVTIDFSVFRDTGELPGSNEARFEVVYEFSLGFADGATELYCGRAFWDFSRSNLNNEWRLRRWEDLGLPDNPNESCLGTTGRLRVERG